MKNKFSIIQVPHKWFPGLGNQGSVIQEVILPYPLHPQIIVFLDFLFKSIFLTFDQLYRKT
jgi:hypothetical protein